MTKVVYLSFGSNVGNRRKMIERAINRLNQERGVSVLKVSSLFETSPVGGPRQSLYLNGVLKAKVSLTPLKFLRVLKDIEKDLGRKNGPHWGPRPIDLDILTFGRYIIRRKGLTIPHPRYHERRFVLVPFCQLAPRFIHPIYRRTNRTFLHQLTPLGQRVTMHSRWKK